MFWFEVQPHRVRFGLNFNISGSTSLAPVWFPQGDRFGDLMVCGLTPTEGLTSLVLVDKCSMFCIPTEIGGVSTS